MENERYIVVLEDQHKNSLKKIENEFLIGDSLIILVVNFLAFFKF